MGKRQRIPKTLQRKLADLDDHLWFVRRLLNDVQRDATCMKMLVAELRTLICKSSGTEGLLWRVAGILAVDDTVLLHEPLQLDRSNPLAKHMSMYMVPLCRGGHGDVRLPVRRCSLFEIIKHHEAVVAQNESITHETLIKIVAQQMGSSHEDDGIDQELAQLANTFLMGKASYAIPLETDARLTAEVGNRVLDVAEEKQLYRRRIRQGHDGDLSVVHISKPPALPISLPLFQCYFPIGGLTVFGIARSDGIVFCLSRQQWSAELVAPYPSNWSGGQPVSVCFSYCSRVRQARILTASGYSRIHDLPQSGWNYAEDLRAEQPEAVATKPLGAHGLGVFRTIVTESQLIGLTRQPEDFLRYNGTPGPAGMPPW